MDTNSSGLAWLVSGAGLGDARSEGKRWKVAEQQPLQIKMLHEGRILGKAEELSGKVMSVNTNTRTLTIVLKGYSLRFSDSSQCQNRSWEKRGHARGSGRPDESERSVKFVPRPEGNLPRPLMLCRAKQYCQRVMARHPSQAFTGKVDSTSRSPERIPSWCCLRFKICDARVAVRHFSSSWSGDRQIERNP